MNPYNFIEFILIREKWPARQNPLPSSINCENGQGVFMIFQERFSPSASVDGNKLVTSISSWVSVGLLLSAGSMEENDISVVISSMASSSHSSAGGAAVKAVSYTHLQWSS